MRSTTQSSRPRSTSPNQHLTKRCATATPICNSTGLLLLRRPLICEQPGPYILKGCGTNLLKGTHLASELRDRWPAQRRKKHHLQCADLSQSAGGQLSFLHH